MNRSERRRRKFAGDTGATITKREEVRESGFTKPHTLTGIDVWAGGDMRKLLPPMSQIPAEFQKSTNVWVRIQQKWFFSGIDSRIFQAKPGIDRSAALAHLSSIQNSFEPKHEHKEAGVAYLMSLWFEETDFVRAAAGKK